jgi:hypothetical protein
MAVNQTAFDLVRRRSGVTYPSPYFDISSTYVPPSVKEMFKWCRFFYFSHSVISPIIYKMAEYPITGLFYQAKTEDDTEENKLPERSKDNWKKLLETTLNIKPTLIEILLDYNVYGNAFISILYPFKRYLVCPECEGRRAIEKMSYKWHDIKFKGTCPECAQAVAFNVEDVQIKNRSMCKLIRWNPFNIDMDHCQPTDERVYVYKIPSKDRKAIISGKKFWIERAPYIFIDAVRKNQNIELDTNNLFHFKRPMIADQDMAWGMPIILPVIKDAYWLQILRKANEAISLDHIVPWRIIYPAANAEVSPYINQNLGSWKDKIEKEVRRWRNDPNHISIFPLPIGSQTFGGDGKLLQVWQEEKVLQQQIAGGMGVPLEFIFGGLNWTGSSISLRVLENHFLTDRELIDNFLNEYLVPNLQRYFRLPAINIRQRDFKMADDVQQKQLAMQLNQMGKISDTTLLGESGWDFEKEVKIRMQEQNMLIASQVKTVLQQAEIQGMQQITTAKYQTIAQMEALKLQTSMSQQMAAEQGGMPIQVGEGGQPGQPGAPAQGGQPGQATAQPGQVAMGKGGVVAPMKDTPEMIDAMAKSIMNIPPAEREAVIKQYEQMDPETGKKLRKALEKMQKATTDMRPLPDQKPPRRKAGIV